MSNVQAAQTEPTTAKPNGSGKTAAKNRGRVISHPGDVAGRTARVLATPPNRNHHKAVLEPVAIDRATTS